MIMFFQKAHSNYKIIPAVFRLSMLLLVLLIMVFLITAPGDFVVNDNCRIWNSSIAVASSKQGNFSISLNEGWNLISLPLWANEIVLEDNDIEAWLTYKEGSWLQSDDEKAFYLELNNPAQAVFIKAIRPTSISFRWAEPSPGMQFAEQQLIPGWNLISCSLQVDYRTILAGVYYDGTNGLTKIYAPNEYNGVKEKGFHLPWNTKLNDLTNPSQAQAYDMYPLDGYWVFLEGRELIFSTPVGNELPGRTDN